MKRFVLVVFLSLLRLVSHAQTTDNDTLIAGSQKDDFVKVSLLLASPGNSVYSVFGHSGLRLQCPSQHLDYVYTFEMEAGLTGYLKFFLGQAKAGFAAVNTSDYLALYRKEGRGVTAYTLNLTPHEEQELWRMLDNDMVEGPHRKYNLIKNQCLSMSLLMIESILEKEYIDFKGTPHQLNGLDNGKLIRYYSRHSSWGQFLYMTFIGSEADEHWELEYTLAPETMPYILRHARIVATYQHTSRPLMKGQPTVLVPTLMTPQPTWLTPTLFFGILLVLTLCLTLLQLGGRYRRMAHVFDVCLFVIQSLIGILLLYVTLVTNLFGLHWNWYLIPFNPLPLVLWLAFRHKSWYTRVYPFYLMVLILFIPLMFVCTEQADVAHALFIGIFALRLLAECLQRRWVTVNDKD